MTAMSCKIACLFFVQGASCIMNESNKGFTLIELMMVVAIIGILSAVALPVYSGYVQDGRRADAQQFLMQRAGVLERNYTRLGAYPVENDFTIDNGDYYSYSYRRTSDTEFVLVAKPKGAQASDVCGSLTINQQGKTTALKTNCWS